MINHYSYRFCRIHRRASTNTYYKITTCFNTYFSGLHYSFYRWVFLYAIINCIFNILRF